MASPSTVHSFTWEFRCHIFKKQNLFCIALPLITLITACSTLVPVGPVEPTKIVDKQMAKRIWIAKPDISKLDHTLITRQGGYEDALSENIKQFMVHSDYSKNIEKAPGIYQKGDLTFKFSFTNLQIKRKPHSAYFPGAILTLTLWIWVNGPIFTDQAVVNGSLEVQDYKGRTITTVTSRQQSKTNEGLWGGHYLFPDQ